MSPWVPMAFGAFMALGAYSILDGAGERSRIIRRLTEGMPEGMPEVGVKGEESKGALLRVYDYMGGVTGKRYIDQVEAELWKAGIKTAPRVFLGRIAFLAALALVLGFLPGKGHSLAVVLPCLAVVLLPVAYVRFKGNARRNRFASQLVGALSVLSSSLRAGHSFMQSMETIARESRNPMSEEFDRVLKEIRVGMSVDEALTNLAQRMPLKELDLVVTGMLINRQVGGNLAEISDKASETVRDRLRIKMQIRTLTASGRLTGLVISLLPFVLAFLINAMDPGYVTELFTQPVGRLMLGVGLVLEALGILAVQKIVDIKY